jgi:transcriptional regulator with XRE-family HTH domain
MLYRALKMIRIYHNLTQVQLAEKIKLQASFICELEKNKKKPSIETLEQYAKCFNIPISNIMLFSEHLENEKPSVHKIRIKCADKILKMLEWICDIENIEK